MIKVNSPGDQLVCDGDKAILEFDFTGQSPWTVDFYHGSCFHNLTAYSDTMVDVELLYEANQYIVTHLQDQYCAKDIIDQQIQVLRHTEIALQNITTNCDPGGQEYIVSFEIEGGNPANYNVFPDNGSITTCPPYTFVSDPIEENSSYTFHVTDDMLCDEAVTSGIKSCNCIASGVISGTEVICSEDTATLSIQFTGTAPWNFSIESNSGDIFDFISHESDFDFLVSPETSKIYSITYIEDANCIGTSYGYGEVIVNPIPSVDFYCTDECVGMPLEFINNSSVCSGNIVEYCWSFDDNGTISYEESPVYIFQTSGDHNVNLKVKTDKGCYNNIEKPVMIFEPVMVSTVDEISILPGSEIIVSGEVTGGSGRYGFSWEPDSLVIDPHAMQTMTLPIDEPGIFTLYVKDSLTSCYDESSINVLLLGDNLDLVISADNAEICNGFSVQLNAEPSGGTGVYTYQWFSKPAGINFDIDDPIVTPLENTVYYVVVNDGRTNIIDSISIAVLSRPDVFAGGDRFIPYGSYTDLEGTVSGGTPPYSVHWSPDYAVLNAGEINTTTQHLIKNTLFKLSAIDDNGCYSEDELVVNVEGTSMIAYINYSPSDTICHGESIDMEVIVLGGTQNYSYTWFDPEGNLIGDQHLLEVKPEYSGKYSAIIDGGYSSVVVEQFINVMPDPDANLLPEGYQFTNGDTIMVCVFDTLLLSPDIQGYDYFWSDGHIGYERNIYRSGIGNEVQFYWLYTYDPETGCSDSSSIHIAFDYGACLNTEIIDPGEINIYPNPTNGPVTIELTNFNGPYEVSVINTGGIEIFKESIIDFNSSYKHTIDFSGLPNGIYLYKLMTDSRFLIEKIVVF